MALFKETTLTVNTGLYLDSVLKDRDKISLGFHIRCAVVCGAYGGDGKSFEASAILIVDTADSVMKMTRDKDCIFMLLKNMKQFI